MINEPPSGAVTIPVAWSRPLLSGRRMQYGLGHVMFNPELNRDDGLRDGGNVPVLVTSFLQVPVLGMAATKAK